MARTAVTFELERFGWIEGAPVLEVAGRWRGPRRRRLGPASLVVDAAGQRRLTAIASTGDVRVDPDPGRWRAEFAWPGALAEIEGAELEVGSSLVIELPAPDGPSPARGIAGRAPAGADEAIELAALRRQAEAERQEGDRLRATLATIEGDHVAALERALAAAAQARSEEQEAVRRKSEEVDKRHRDELAAARKAAAALEKRHDEALAAARKEAAGLGKRHDEALAAARKEAATADERHRDELAAARKAAEAAEKRHHEALATAGRQAAESAEAEIGALRVQIEAAERRLHEGSGAVVSAAEADVRRLTGERDTARTDAQRLRTELEALQPFVIQVTPRQRSGPVAPTDATVEWSRGDTSPPAHPPGEDPTVEQTDDLIPFQDGEPTTEAGPEARLEGEPASEPPPHASSRPAPRAPSEPRTVERPRSLFDATASRSQPMARPRTPTMPPPRDAGERPARDSPVRGPALAVVVGVLVLLVVVVALFVV